MADEQIDPIDLKVLGRFGIGKSSNSLYFDGQKVHTDAYFNLTPRQASFAWVVAIFTVLGGIATVAYSSVYIYDALFRKKPSPQVIISTSDGMSLPVKIDPPATQNVPNTPKPDPKTSAPPTNLDSPPLSQPKPADATPSQVH